MAVIRILISLLLGVCFVPSAFANSICGLYIAPRALFVVQETTAQAKFLQKEWGPKKIYAAKLGGSFALGYDLRAQYDIPVRLELEYGAFEHVSKCGKARILRTPTEFKAKLAVQTLLSNLYVDFPVSSKLVPFISGGIGTAFIKSNTKTFYSATEQHKSVLAGQLGVGCSYMFTPRVALEAGCRFFMLDSIADKNTSIHINFCKNKIYQILLGFRLKF